MVRLDPHSYADDAQPRTVRMNLQLYVDFRKSEVRGDATVHLDRAADGVLDMDTRDLQVESVTSANGEPIRFELGNPDPILGQRLRVFLTADAFRIVYRTSTSASALQWLTPAQTAGGRHPFVFTQCQAIHARSVVPCQDTPRIRFRFEAAMNVPAALTAVMAAAPVGRQSAEDGRVVHRFEMPQPIPPYLFAFAVGDLAAADLGPRSCVYAEPAVLEAAASEFADVDEHLAKAEALFGPYVWDRFDILVMPPSFPYGGMENPRLTFVTPSLITGDRSLVSVIAHELAHSWTGNLVTNANANHFWLNEGFTVYAERRIVEALYGEAARTLQASVGRADLDNDMARLSKIDPRLTQLRVDLEGRSPDEVFSTVPYEKGYLFLLRLEQNVGRPRFDAFIARYIERFSFTSIDTADLLAFIRDEFDDLLAGIDVDSWIDGQGLPSDAPRVASNRLDQIVALAEGWSRGRRPEQSSLETLSPDEWQAFLSALPAELPTDDIEWMEQTFAPSTSNNPEIRVGWLRVAVRSGYRPAFDRAEATLKQFGRMKYLRPLYTALVESGDDGRARAAAILAGAKDGYHPIARSLAESLVA